MYDGHCERVAKTEVGDGKKIKAAEAPTVRKKAPPTVGYTWAVVVEDDEWDAYLSRTL